MHVNVVLLTRVFNVLNCLFIYYQLAVVTALVLASTAVCFFTVQSLAQNR